MRRPTQTDKRTGARPKGRQTAVGPGDRRDGQPLIFGWGGHLTRAQKQKYRGRFVLAAGLFVFFLVAVVLGIGALQQFYVQPRSAVATVNGHTIERQWYEKNRDYTTFTLQHDAQDVQNQFQALTANVQANAQATSTALGTPPPGSTPSAGASAGATTPATPAGSAAPSGSAGASAASASAPSASVSPETSASTTPSATSTPTPAPTFNPTQQATAAALQEKFSGDQSGLSVANQQTLENLIDTELMRQNAAKFGISLSQDDINAQVKKTTDQLGGDSVVKQLSDQAHLSQNDFTQIQSDLTLQGKYQQYFAAHPGDAPAATPTTAPTPVPTVAITGPLPPTPTALPTPVPTPGAGSLDRWLNQERQTASISRAPLPTPTTAPSASA